MAGKMKMSGGKTGGNFGSTKKAYGNKIFTGPLGKRPSKSR